MSEEDRRRFAEVGGWRQFEKNSQDKMPGQNQEQEQVPDIDWILESEIRVQKIGEFYHVYEQAEPKRLITLCYYQGRLLFNMHDIETESYMGYVGLMDAIDEGQTHFKAER